MLILSNYSLMLGLVSPISLKAVVPLVQEQIMFNFVLFLFATPVLCSVFAKQQNFAVAF